MAMNVARINGLAVSGAEASVITSRWLSRRRYININGE